MNNEATDMLSGSIYSVHAECSYAEDFSNNIVVPGRIEHMSETTDMGRVLHAVEKGLDNLMARRA